MLQVDAAPKASSSLLISLEPPACRQPVKLSTVQPLCCLDSSVIAADVPLLQLQQKMLQGPLPQHAAFGLMLVPSAQVAMAHSNGKPPSSVHCVGLQQSDKAWCKKLANRSEVARSQYMVDTTYLNAYLRLKMASVQLTQ